MVDLQGGHGRGAGYCGSAPSVLIRTREEAVAVIRAMSAEAPLDRSCDRWGCGETLERISGAIQPHARLAPKYLPGEAVTY